MRTTVHVEENKKRTALEVGATEHVVIYYPTTR
jgi:hypothetical protein